jgi:nucleotide-binding universal stress UspA family protein
MRMSVPSHVLVLYRRSSNGDDALMEASQLAREAGARMTVVTVALVERCNRRCCNIRSSYWNGVVRELADDDLRDATKLLGDTRGVEFAVASGESLPRVLAQEAAGRDCDLIVLPRTARRWLPLGANRLARKLSRSATCDVIELPSPAA